MKGVQKGCGKVLSCPYLSLFCKLAELNSYSYIDKHNLYIYSNFCCSGMNTILTVETIHHHYRHIFDHLHEKSIFNNDVIFDSLQCYFYQTLYG